ncbi:MAG: hypothetical protein NC453_10600 [Muribaculum sp.]|nr:hypothetical protein [Muribaculum sp.]
MKNRWNLEIDDTKQILGGFLELTKEMTEKQMIAYVTKIARQYMLNESKIERYGIWAEAEEDDDISFHITASRHWKGYIDIMVYDAKQGAIIVDTARERREKEEAKWQEDMAKFYAEHNL